MNLVPHVALSGAAGAGVWAATGELNAVPAAIAAGVLPDADHLLDYYLRYFRGRWDRLYLLLHGWEYLLAGTLVYLLWVREPWLLAVLLGYLTQVGGDQVYNWAFWHTYFLTGRAVQGFRAEKVRGEIDYHSYMAVVRLLPFGRRRLARWFEGRTPPHEHIPVPRRRGLWPARARRGRVTSPGPDAPAPPV